MMGTIMIGTGQTIKQLETKEKERVTRETKNKKLTN
jgi:hypothetical protein